MSLEAVLLPAPDPDPFHTEERQAEYEYEKSIADPVTGKFYSKEEFLEVAKTNPTKEILFYKQPEENIEKWLRLTGVALANDALMATDHDAPWDTPYEELEGLHPRTGGARGLALRYAREKNRAEVRTDQPRTVGRAIHGRR